jgi:hypothetical protein
VSRYREARFVSNSATALAADEQPLTSIRASRDFSKGAAASTRWTCPGLRDTWGVVVDVDFVLFEPLLSTA